MRVDNRASIAYAAASARCVQCLPPPPIPC